MYHKSRHTLRLERKRQWSRNAVAAKARLRLARVQESVEVGVIRFSGPMFGGAEHVLRCLVRDADPALLIEIDGLAHRPRSIRGLRKLLAERILQS